MSTGLIIPPVTTLAQVAFSNEAIALRDSALEACALIGRVSNPDENALASSSHRQIRDVIAAVEKARKAGKEPILEAGRIFDGACASFIADLKREELRITTIIGNYQQEELAKQRAEARRIADEQAQVERDRLEEIARIDREALAAAKAATSAAEMEAAAARATAAREFAATEAAQRIESIKPAAVAPVRAEGQIVRPKWEIVQIDSWTLAKARPDLVRAFEWDRVGITAALNRGEKLPGVTAREVVTVSTRSGAKQTIDV